MEQRKLRRSVSQPGDESSPPASASMPMGSPPLPGPAPHRAHHHGHSSRATSKERHSTASPPPHARPKSSRSEVVGELRSSDGLLEGGGRDLQDFMREEAALLRQRYEEQRRTAEEERGERDAELAKTHRVPDRRVSLSLLADWAEEWPALSLHDLQVHMWTTLFTIAHRTDSSSRFPHFLLLLEVLARLLPDVRSGKALEEELRRGVVLDAYHKVSNKRELVMWLHALHDQVNQRCEQPFYAVSMQACTGADPQARYALSRQRFQLCEPRARGPENCQSLMSRLLPDELLLNVFSYLAPTSLMRCVRVCRRWNRVADDSQLWRSLFTREFEVSGEELMRINQSHWKRNVFAWRTWEILSEVFDGDEPDTEMHMVVEKEEEEWVMEERDVELLQHDEGKLEPEAGHVARKKVTRARRRKRLSISLALQYPTGSGESRFSTIGGPVLHARSTMIAVSAGAMTSLNSNTNVSAYAGHAHGAPVDWSAAQQAQYMRLLGLDPLPDLLSLLPPLSLKLRVKPHNPPFHPTPSTTSLSLGTGISPAATLVTGASPPGASSAASAAAKAEEESQRPRTISQIRRLKAAVSGSRLRHATLPKLVEHLTSPFSHDLDYMKTFLLTYYLFATPDVLLALLLRRYFVQQPMGFGADEWQRLVQRPIQLRVINIVKSWIENYYADFDEHLVACLTRFARHVLTDKLSRQILAILARQKSLSAGPSVPHTKDYQFSELPPYPDVPKHIFSARLSIWDISDLEIARQLTLIEFSLFSAITPRELLCYAQCRSRSGGSEAVGVLPVVEAPHVAAMLARFRGTAKWVTGVLNAAPKGKERTRYLRRLVGIAQETLRLGNFNTLMAILTGLERHRGTDTGEELSTRYKRDWAMMEALLTEPELYANTLQSRAPAIIPYVEWHLKKLQQILELVPGTKAQLVHWAKYKYLYAVAARISDYQQTPYNLQPVAQIAALLAWKEDDPRDDELRS